jgi:microcystin-dependent protein
MGQPFLGEIWMFSGYLRPEGWALCDGTVLPINGRYEALYAVIGTAYGGNAETSFALPDFEPAAQSGRAKVRAARSNWVKRRTPPPPRGVPSRPRPCSA